LGNEEVSEWRGEGVREGGKRDEVKGKEEES
jgi:hypothetical protein